MSESPVPAGRAAAEFRRLYLPGEGPDRVDAQGRVRAAVLELARPADWDRLGAVWRAVQAEHGLPAPAIAVSGADAVQLWFSLAAPCPAAQVGAWLDGLRRQHLADVAPQRLCLWPAADGSGPPPAAPGGATQPGCWSAFVSPDLAPVFAETPWLEMPPSDEGQARLLADLRPIDPAALEPPAAPAAPAPASPPTLALPRSAQPCADVDPAAFLRSVMADASAPLALRVEAAKALLQHGPAGR